MKKKLLILLTLATLLTGCNYKGYDFIDNDYHFDTAYIRMPNGDVICGSIKKWADSEDGEQLTITLKDGRRFLVNSVNCVLVEENK